MHCSSRERESWKKSPAAMAGDHHHHDGESGNAMMDRRIRAGISTAGFVILVSLVMFLLSSGGGARSAMEMGFYTRGFLQRPNSSVQNTTLSLSSENTTTSPSSPTEQPTEQEDDDDASLLGGLLSPSFDKQQCLSRYQSTAFRRHPGRRPSPYLTHKLRQQEALQQKCGPGTEPYRLAADQLNAAITNPINLNLTGSNNGDDDPECKYLVVNSEMRGLGNRMLETASAFLYAVLTGRTLLLDARSMEFDPVFCEPFPDTTWSLPPDSPMTREFFWGLGDASPESLGNLINASTTPESDIISRQSFVYVHLNGGHTHLDFLFFCGQQQRLLRRVPWLILRGDMYFLPGFYVDGGDEGFADEIDKMFPEKDAVFHHLGRYLFHPKNAVWGLIVRYYRAYLAGADRRVGIQVRVFTPDRFASERRLIPAALDQVLACIDKESLLPAINVNDTDTDVIVPAGKTRTNTTAVLVTSLQSWYFEKIKARYWEHGGERGDRGGEEVVSVQQTCHDEEEKWGAAAQAARAAADIYLLSYMDEMVTSGYSTFGYVAKALAGDMARPALVMDVLGDHDVPDPPCVRATSMEPCFLYPPGRDHCEWQTGGGGARRNASVLAAHVTGCEDLRWGIKFGR